MVPKIAKDPIIREILKNPNIMCENLGQKKGHGIEYELSPIYTAEELKNELHSMNCEAPNVFVFYKDNKITVEFEHHAIQVSFDPKYCQDCDIGTKCPRYAWHTIAKR